MNKEVENIQKNLQTVFEGYVNGQKFTSREVMNQFIGKCISEGTPITDISYSTTTQYKPQGNDGTQQRQPSTHMRPGYNAIRRAQEEISWVTYLNNINQRVPKPYDNVIGYVVPFVREDITINDTNAEYIIEDFKARLNDRMEFLENLVFAQIRTWKYDESQVNQWVELLFRAFEHKLEWANERVALIEDFLNNGNTFILQHIDTAALRGFYTIYTETAGFCSAMMDIIADLQKRMQCGCGK